METKKCKKCKEEIKADAKTCPKCGAGQGNPTWAKVLVGFIIVVTLIGLLGGGEETSETKSSSKEQKVKIKVVDLSNMTTAERDTWCADNKVKCTTKTEYSDTITKNEFISQSIAADKEIYEGDEIVIKISLGKKPTVGQQNALAKAKTYSEVMHMSKKGIYDQLVSEYGEGFTAEEAQYAIDNLAD